MKLSIDMKGALGAVKGIEVAAEKAARPAAAAGARVLYAAVKGNVAALGKYTGKLDSSIYWAYSPESSGDKKAVYKIGWNHKKAPHAHLVEFGYIQRWRSVQTKSGKWITLKNQPLDQPRQVPGKAFLRRGMDVQGQAEQAMRARFIEVLNEHI